MGGIPIPYGGDLVENIVDQEQRNALWQKLCGLPSWTLTENQASDLELLLNGSFSPMRGFMNRDDYIGCCENMRLTNGLLWPCPVTLNVGADCAKGLQSGDSLVLREPEGMALAVLEVEDVWEPDEESESGFLSEHSDGGLDSVDSSNHIRFCLGGRILGLSAPIHYDFVELRKTPREIRDQIARNRIERVAAYFTRQYMFRPQFESTFRAATQLRSGLLINSIVPTRWAEGVDHFYRVRSQRALIRRYPNGMSVLNVLPLVFRRGLLRRMILSAVVARNFGCNHVLVDESSLADRLIGQQQTPDEEDRIFRDLEDALDQFASYQKELVVKISLCKRMVYLEGPDGFVPRDRVTKNAVEAELTREECIRRLESGEQVPAWFTFPDVLEEVKKAHLPRARKGFTLFFTGLSGSGKSTLAKVLRIMLLEAGDRQVTLLDGDIVRRHLSKKLGFSREDRDTNILRIGFVAAEITKNGGIAICAPIAPYGAVRKRVRSMIEKRGGFILIHMNTSLDVCEKRDPKGMYAKARAGLIDNFTGISDPYERPEDAELVVDAAQMDPKESAENIMTYLKSEGYIRV